MSQNRADEWGGGCQNPANTPILRNMRDKRDLNSIRSVAFNFFYFNFGTYLSESYKLFFTQILFLNQKFIKRKESNEK